MITMSPAATTTRKFARAVELTLERQSTPPSRPGAPAIRPSSLSRPVATTIPSPRPRTTDVPAYAIDRRSESGASTGSGAVAASTGTDSPVRRLRSMVGLMQLTRKSAGTSRRRRSDVAGHQLCCRGPSAAHHPPDARLRGSCVTQSFHRPLGAELRDDVGADDRDEPDEMSPSRTSPRRSARTPAIARTTTNGSVAASTMDARTDLPGGSSSLRPTVAGVRRLVSCPGRVGEFTARPVATSSAVAALVGLRKLDCCTSPDWRSSRVAVGQTSRRKPSRSLVAAATRSIVISETPGVIDRTRRKAERPNRAGGCRGWRTWLRRTSALLPDARVRPLRKTPPQP